MTTYIPFANLSSLLHTLISFHSFAIEPLPYAFTEHGVAMLATILNSDRAVAISINIIKVFIKLREVTEQHKFLAKKLKILESKVGRHDKEIRAILEAIRQLTAPPLVKKKAFIGFHP